CCPTTSRQRPLTQLNAPGRQSCAAVSALHFPSSRAQRWSLGRQKPAEHWMSPVHFSSGLSRQALVPGLTSTHRWLLEQFMSEAQFAPVSPLLPWCTSSTTPKINPPAATTPAAT